MEIFKDQRTGKDAIIIDAGGLFKEGENVISVREPNDLPDPHPSYSYFGIPPEIWKLQGKTGLYHYFTAFLPKSDGFMMIIIDPELRKALK